ncbi:uncharacterized protein TRIADDRAFT_52384 [Trichoplax adhaerens]|uniref:Uncharacterized protein n=1 Tax=Trichoplax adhaerens TaxID=10228 RepID=B3RI83_TRIAD|nr:hypothetical protein TRIADDRAFT_52384 [Trichoplax adhaerens]EDV29707.1 hypothetical protein TRIADDRAFT_52384 [Trichoplax adhaerens]|eukprot:XP_002108909.1 hypothetical protein TRIADDRAFT_52384 [Trichoplax adhaerens]
METLLLPDGREIATLKVVDLRAELKRRGLTTSGAKKVLADRLKQFLLKEVKSTSSCQSQFESLPSQDVTDVRNQENLSPLQAQESEKLKAKEERSCDNNELSTSVISDDISPSSELDTNRRDTENSDDLTVVAMPSVMDELYDDINNRLQQYDSNEYQRDTQVIHEDEHNKLHADDDRGSGNESCDKQHHRENSKIDLQEQISVEKETENSPSTLLAEGGNDLDHKFGHGRERTDRNVSVIPKPLSKRVPEGKNNSQSDVKKESDSTLKTEDNCSLWIGGLQHKVRAADLKDKLSEYGKVISATIIISMKSLESKYYGHVQMARHKEAAECIACLNNTNISGSVVTIEWATSDHTSKAQVVRGDQEASKSKFRFNKELSEDETLSNSNRSNIISKSNDGIRKGSNEEALDVKQGTSPRSQSRNGKVLTLEEIRSSKLRRQNKEEHLHVRDRFQSDKARVMRDEDRYRNRPRDYQNRRRDVHHSRPNPESASRYEQHGLKRSAESPDYRSSGVSGAKRLARERTYEHSKDTARSINAGYRRNNLGSELQQRRSKDSTHRDGHSVVRYHVHHRNDWGKPSSSEEKLGSYYNYLQTRRQIHTPIRLESRHDSNHHGRMSRSKHSYNPTDTHPITERSSDRDRSRNSARVVRSSGIRDREPNKDHSFRSTSDERSRYKIQREAIHRDEGRANWPGSSGRIASNSNSFMSHSERTNKHAAHNRSGFNQFPNRDRSVRNPRDDRHRTSRISSAGIRRSSAFATRN